MSELKTNQNGQWELLEKNAAAGAYSVPDSPTKRKRKNTGESVQYAGPSPSLDKSETIVFSPNGQWSLT